MSRLARTLPILIALMIPFGNAPCAQAHQHGPAEEMAEAVAGWLATLSPELRRAATFAFESSEREAWHFIPKDRVGVSLREQDLEQRRAAHRILRTALSNRGYLKSVAIMRLEHILRSIESDRENVDEIRHPGKYWLAVFGDPGGEKPWGWRIEGHHLSLNFSVVPGEGIAAAPSFYGANPAEVREGPFMGLRVLGEEEALARKLLGMLDQKQRPKTLLAQQAPDEVITVPGVSPEEAEAAGLGYAEMDPPQQAVLRKLVSELTGNLRDNLAGKQLREIEEAGWENVYFGWAGSSDPGQGHYFRVRGPTFLIEYDNTQNNANHVHLVWHSAENNFAADLLRRHYEQHDHRPAATR